MTTHTIREIVDHLVDKKFISPAELQAATRAVARLLSDRILLSWSIGDVRAECPGLSNEEADEVLTTVENDHDASVGVNWEVIRAEALRRYGKRAAVEDE